MLANRSFLAGVVLLCSCMSAAGLVVSTPQRPAAAAQLQQGSDGEELELIVPALNVADIGEDVIIFVTIINCIYYTTIITKINSIL